MKYFLSILCLTAILYSCDKRGEPFAEICTDNSKIYHVGDTLRLDNCSKRYTKQRWVLPDATTSYGDYVYYVASTSGTFTFRLYVSNDKFVNDFETSKSITVQP